MKTINTVATTYCQDLSNNYIKSHTSLNTELFAIIHNDQVQEEGRASNIMYWMKSRSSPPVLCLPDTMRNLWHVTHRKWPRDNNRFSISINQHKIPSYSLCSPIIHVLSNELTKPSMKLECRRLAGRSKSSNEHCMQMRKEESSFVHNFIA